jgi:hypothetical protein
MQISAQEDGTIKLKVESVGNYAWLMGPDQAANTNADAAGSADAAPSHQARAGTGRMASAPGAADGARSAPSTSRRRPRETGQVSDSPAIPPVGTPGGSPNPKPAEHAEKEARTEKVLELLEELQELLEKVPGASGDLLANFSARFE